MQVDAAVVLDTMWGGWGGNHQAPRWFRIDPENHSGRRLHWLLEGHSFWVTNACRAYVAHAGQHGTPDPVWLADNLKRVQCRLLLVCGRVAQATYDRCGHQPQGHVLRIMHPASRTWTRAELDRAKGQVQRLLGASQ